MKEFLYLVSLEEFYTFLRDFKSIDETESLSLIEGYFRVTKEDVVAKENIPSYKRSSVDGYAINYEETIGASNASPVILKNIGEIEMGKDPSFSISEGETAYIPTGGALPNGTNSVVMIENTERSGDIVEIYKQVSNYENVILEGDDFKKGSIVIKKGERIKSKNIGAISACGVNKVNVYPLPKVSIFSTGNEIVEKKENKYQILDSNTYTVYSILKKYSVPKRMGILKDNYDDIYDAISEVYDDSDIIVLSGGSSMGVRDYTLEIFKKFGEPVYQIHGIRIKPGKPTIVYITKDKIFVGLPGHPVSSFMSTLFVLLPLVKKYSGEKDFITKPSKFVKSSIRIPSQEGRKDFYRVNLNGDEFAPIFAKSSSLSSLAYCDGIIEIDENREGIYSEETVPFYSLEDV
jgi:molybdopterin molybdotransferase